MRDEKILQEAWRYIPQDYIKNTIKFDSLEAHCEEMRGDFRLLHRTVRLSVGHTQTL